MLNFRKLVFASGAFVLVAAAAGAFVMAAPSAPAPAPKESVKATPAADQAWVTTVSTTRQQSRSVRDPAPTKPSVALRSGSPSHPERAAANEVRVPLMLGVTY
jgi:hypothetical protein